MVMPAIFISTMPTLRFTPFGFLSPGIPMRFLICSNPRPITIEEWFKWRSILARGTRKASLLERGFATLFMNRTNRSGILKAGVIGGKNQSGDYKLDARFKKEVMAARIKAIAMRADDISVYCEDSLRLLNRCSKFSAEAVFDLP
jgi:DNA adenine methylase